MKKFIEGLKDFIYDAMDYFLIIVIVVVVAGVIGWRLDILFAKDMDKSTSDYAQVDENNKDISSDLKPDDQISKDDSENETPVDSSTDNENSEDNSETPKDNTDNSNEPQDTPSDSVDEYVTVQIPSGSLPPSIANILIDKGLINDKWEFLSKSQEMKLDTKLKSGNFQIKVNSSIESIIQTLAK